MANVEHSALTGSDLHEPKGVAAAVANRVYVSNGSASGSWTTVGNSVLAAEAKSFQGGLLHIQDQKASGSNGGTFTSAGWRTRTLTTVVTNEITSSSLSSNQITLPAGTYYIDASSCTHWVSCNKLRLRNITDSTSTLIGLTTGDGDNNDSIATLRGRFTIASAKVFEIQHYCTGGGTNDGFGFPVSSGELEIYSDISIWKTA